MSRNEFKKTPEQAAFAAAEEKRILRENMRQFSRDYAKAGQILDP